MGVTSHPTYLRRLLRYGAFERRPNGGWRFGVRVIPDRIAERLVAQGWARIAGDRLEAITEAPAE
jgi:hypothetical protein